jgi:hypothetical protein
MINRRVKLLLQRNTYKMGNDSSIFIFSGDLSPKHLFAVLKFKGAERPKIERVLQTKSQTNGHSETTRTHDFRI